MNDSTQDALEGACDCGAVRYRLLAAPLFVNCCHCHWCQRETGSAFAINALIEHDMIMLLSGEVRRVLMPSASGKGQLIARCPHCLVALWSHYGGSGPFVSFVRVGTLDAPQRLSPDIHIYTTTRQPWVQLPTDRPAMPEYYDLREHWPAASLARLEALKPQIRAWRAGGGVWAS